MNHVFDDSEHPRQHRHCGPERAWDDSEFGPQDRVRRGPAGRGGAGDHHQRHDRRSHRDEGIAAFFGPDGPFGPGGPFGASGPFGPDGPFGPGGPFGSGRGRGRGHRHGGRGRARRGEVRTAALLLIAEEPRNGYQIIQELEERTGGAWRPSPGAIYPALAQLEDEGLIAATQADGRKAFRITDAGTAEADTWSDRPKPWDPAGDDEPDTHSKSHSEIKAMWGGFKQVATALSAITQTGDEHLARAAADIMDGARRDLYRLLADAGRDDDDTDPTDRETR